MKNLFFRIYDGAIVFCALDLIRKVHLHVTAPLKMRKNDFLKFTNLNLILVKLQNTKTRSKVANFHTLKLVLATKPTLLNKMVLFKKRNNDFQFPRNLTNRSSIS